MRYRRLGRDGPSISVVAFGTWAAGGNWGPVDDGEVVAAMRRAVELGVNAFDTADIYGSGRSEELVGRALGDIREDVFIATKVGVTSRGIDLSPRRIPAACDASLRRLGTDVIDLYQIHWPDDPSIRLEDAWEALAGLRAAGKVRFIGVSNFDPTQLETCERVAHVDSVQNEYSMLVRDPEGGVLPWCRENGTGVLSYGSLAYGVLTGKFDRGVRFPQSDWRSGSFGFGYYDRLFAPSVFEEHLERVDRLRKIAGGLGVSLAQLAVAWLLRDEAVTAAICGAKRPGQIEDTAAAGDLTLDAETIAACEKALAG